MAIGGYQLPSPRAIDPPIGEFQLAQKTSNPDAYMMRLMGQTSLAQDDYDRELGAQHQFALQQMMAQQMDERQKNAIALSARPGGSELLADPGNALGQSLSGNPGALTNLARAGATAQGNINFKNAMEGANFGSQAGVTLPADSYTGMTGLKGFQDTTPRAVTVEQIRAAGNLAAAQARASGVAAPSVSVSVTDPTTQLPMTVRYPGKMTPQQVQQDLRNRGVLNVDTPPPPLALPNAGGGRTSLTPNPGALPPAPKDDGSAGDILSTVPGVADATSGNTSAPPPQATSAAPNNAAAGTAKLQELVNANLGRMPAPVQKDIRAAASKNGGQPVVGVDTDGKPYALGASGQKYKDPSN